MDNRLTMYYVLESKLHKLISSLVFSNGDGWGVDFLSGQHIEPPKNSDELLVEIEQEKVALPDYFDVDGVPIVSQKFVNCITQANLSNVQFFPVEVRFTDSVTQGHYLFNVVGRKNAIHESTECSKFGPSIARLFKLKLDKNEIHGANLFRLHGYQDVIVISEQVKAAIEKTNITGYEIREADGWNDSHRF